MNKFSTLIKDSEVSIAAYIDSLSQQKQVFYTHVKRRSIICAFFHKKERSNCDNFNNKQVYTCKKCLVIWSQFDTKILRKKYKINKG